MAAAAVAAAVTAAVVVTRGGDGQQDAPQGASAGEDEQDRTGGGATEGGEEEAGPILPKDLEEALRDFEGDFRGPWRALGLEAEGDLQASPEEIRAAYRQAVRAEHPDTSRHPDAEDRFRRVRKAYALLMDDGTRALLQEALEQDAGSFQDIQAEEVSEGSRRSLPLWLWPLSAAVVVGAIGLKLSDPQLQPRAVVKAGARRREAAPQAASTVVPEPPAAAVGNLAEVR